MADITNNHVAQANLFQRAAASVSVLRARYAQYKVYRTTLNELQSLTKRELADLGLHHSEIRRVAYHAAYH